MLSVGVFFPKVMPKSKDFVLSTYDFILCFEKLGFTKLLFKFVIYIIVWFMIYTNTTLKIKIYILSLTVWINSMIEEDVTYSCPSIITNYWCDFIITLFSDPWLQFLTWLIILICIQRLYINIFIIFLFTHLFLK